MLRSGGPALDSWPISEVLNLISDHRIEEESQVSIRGWMALLLLTAPLLGSACTPAEDAAAGHTSIRFADGVGFQAQNLTTDLVAVPQGLGLAAVDSGWQRVDDAESTDAWLAITDKLGRFLVFSADADLDQLELELSLGPSGGIQRLPVHVILNDIRVGRLHPKPEWSSVSVPVPPRAVRRGVNVLDLAPRTRKGHQADSEGPQLRLRRIRLRSSAGRPLWPARPQTIQIGEAIEMPVASYLDLVLRVPQDGRIMGSYEVDIAEPSSRPAWVYIQLLDESDTERTLLNKRFLKTAAKARKLDLDLSQWAGQTVRLRVGTTGPGNGVIRWFDLSVTAKNAT